MSKRALFEVGKSGREVRREVGDHSYPIYPKPYLLAISLLLPSLNAAVASWRTRSTRRHLFEFKHGGVTKFEAGAE